MSDKIPDGFFQEAVLKAPYAIAAVSLDGKFLFVNHHFSVLTGYSGVELKSLTWMDITHHEDIGADLLEVAKIVNGTTPYYTMTKRYIKKNGDVIDIELTVYRYPPDGEILMFIAYIKDIMTADVYIKKLTTEVEGLKTECLQFKKDLDDPNRIFSLFKRAIIANWGTITIIFGAIGTVGGWIISLLTKGK